MSFFDKLIKKPLRWAASSLAGKKGRDIVDKYAPLIDEAATYYAPVLAMEESSVVRIIVTEWAKEKGVPADDLADLAAAVEAKMKGAKS